MRGAGLLLPGVLLVFLGACSREGGVGAGSALPVIAEGDSIVIAEYLEPGKSTLFVFGADW